MAASQMAALFQILFWLAMGVLLVVEVILIVGAIRFGRPREGPAAASQGNPRLELLWTMVPALIILALGILSWPALLQRLSDPG